MIKKVAYKEKFSMYVYVPYKQVPEVKKKLRAAGFKKITDIDMDSDHRIDVVVTPETAGNAVSIIDSVIR